MYYIAQIAFFVLALLFYDFNSQDYGKRDLSEGTYITGIPVLLAVILYLDVLLLVVLCMFVWSYGKHTKVPVIDILLLICNGLYAAFWWFRVQDDPYADDNDLIRPVVMALLSTPTLLYALYTLIRRKPTSASPQ